MKRLILTRSTRSRTSPSRASPISRFDFFFRFVWGPLPSPDELATYLGAAHARATPRLSLVGLCVGRWSRSKARRKDLGLVEFCQQYETVELWFDTDPNAQLQLIWLLDYFRSHPKIVARLKLRLVDLEMIELERLGKWMPPAVDVTEEELATASAAWQAYRAPTPEACFDLLGRGFERIAAAQAGC